MHYDSVVTSSIHDNYNTITIPKDTTVSCTCMHSVLHRVYEFITHLELAKMCEPPTKCKDTAKYTMSHYTHRVLPLSAGNS